MLHFTARSRAACEPKRCMGDQAPDDGSEQRAPTRPRLGVRRALLIGRRRLSRELPGCFRRPPVR